MHFYFNASRWRWLAGIVSASLVAVTSAAENVPAPANLGRAALGAALREERLWSKVHAAEALVLEGQGEPVRELLAREPAEGEGVFPRIGRWRLQARQSRNPTERAAVVRRIEAVFLDPAGAPDALQAVETLCKLREVASPAAVAGAQKLAATGSARDRVFAYWFLALTGDAAALEQIVAALNSNDEVARLRAGYALRWLGEKRPAALTQLAATADREPASSAARPYLIGSAYRLRANPARMSAWRTALLELAATGEPGARYDVAQVLMETTTPAELTPWQPLLGGTGDTRIAAGWIYLHVGNRLAPAH